MDIKKLKSIYKIKIRDKKGNEVVPILTDYINSKASSYVEPSRIGTPKGEPIGFSQVKFEISLCLLYETKLKDLAKGLNISYGVLRKWAIEESFKNAVEKHREDFSGFFVKALRQSLDKHHEKVEFFLKKYGNEWKNGEWPSFDCEIFGDFPYYNVMLREQIEIRLIELFNQPEMAGYLTELHNFIVELIRCVPPNNMEENLRKAFEKIYWQTKYLTARTLTNGLMRIATESPEKLSQADRSFIYYAADALFGAIIIPDLEMIFKPTGQQNEQLWKLMEKDFSDS